MKNDKFCFNRTLGYLVLLVLVVVGFFWAMNSATNNKTSTDTKAATRKSKTKLTVSNDAVAPPLFTLTDLRQRATDILGILNTAQNRSATLDVNTITNKIADINVKLTAAVSSYQGIVTQISIIFNDLTGKVDPSSAVTQASANLTAAEQDRDNKLVAKNTAQTNLITAQNTAQTSLAKIQLAKNNVISMINNLITVIRRNTKTLGGARGSTTSIITKLTEARDYTLIYTDYSTLPNPITVKLDSVYSSLQTLTYSGADSNRLIYTNTVALLKAAFTELNNANLDVVAKESIYNQSYTDYEKAKVSVIVANEIHLFVSRMANQTISESSSLIGQLPQNGAISNCADVSCTDITTKINGHITSLNNALATAYSAYNDLDKAITDAGENLSGQVQSYANYCSNVRSEDPSQTFYPLMDSNGIPAAWAQLYYDTYCAKNATDYKWNGLWGNKAKCYTATGLCSTRALCNKRDCVVGINNQIACINREVDVNNCQTKYAQYGIDILQAGFACPPANIGTQYDKLGADYYQLSGGVDTNAISGRKTCINKKLTSESDIQAAKDWFSATVNARIVARNAICKANITFGWKGSPTFGVLPDPNTYLNGAPTDVPKIGMIKYDTCLQLNSTSDRVGASCINKEVADAYCQCKDFGYRTYRDGALYNSTNIRCRLIPTPAM